MPVRVVQVAGCSACWAVEGVALASLHPHGETGIAMDLVVSTVSGLMGFQVSGSIVSEGSRVVAIWPRSRERDDEFLDRIADLNVKILDGDLEVRDLSALVDRLEPNFILGRNSGSGHGGRVNVAAESSGAREGKVSASSSKLALLDTGLDSGSGVYSWVSDAVDCATCEALTTGKCKDKWLPDADPEGHGTCVAAQAIEMGDLVDREPFLIVARVAFEGVATAASLVGGIDAALDKGAETILVSQTGLCPSLALRRTLERAASRAIVVVATPNALVDLERSPRWPAAYGWPLTLPMSGARSSMEGSMVIAPNRAYGKTVVARAIEYLDEKAKALVQPYKRGACAGSGTSFAAAAAAGKLVEIAGRPADRLYELLKSSRRVNEGGTRTCAALALAGVANPSVPSLDGCKVSVAHRCEGASWSVGSTKHR